MNVRFPFREERFAEFLRYLTGCGCNLTFKLLLSAIFSACGFSIWIGYLLTQLLLLFSSFFFHYFITFQKKFEGLQNFIFAMFRFAATVIGFMAADYGLVTFGVTSLERFIFRDANSYWQQELFHATVILCASGFLFLLRFFCFRFIFRKKSS